MGTLQDQLRDRLAAGGLPAGDADAPGPGPAARAAPIGYDPLPLRPGRINLVGANNVRWLCDHILDRARPRPLILLSPYQGRRRGPVDATQLALAVDGVADVALIVEWGVTYLMRDIVGEAFTCYGGAARVVPHPAAERLMTGTGLFLAPVLEARTGPDAVDLLAAAARAAALIPRHPAPRPRADPVARTGPKDVAAALQQLAGECPHLEFLDSAHASAERSPYRYPNRVLDACRALNDAAAELKDTGRAGSLAIREALRSRSLFDSYRSRVSETAEKQFAADYTWTVNGERTLVGQHLTIGSGMAQDECISIHFLHDPAAGRFTVVHCGAHGRNTLSN